MFETNHLALAVALMVSGFDLRDLVVEGKKGKFVFDDTPLLNQAIEDFWNKSLPVDAQTYFTQIRFTKDRIATLLKNPIPA